MGNNPIERVNIKRLSCSLDTCPCLMQKNWNKIPLSEDMHASILNIFFFFLRLCGKPNRLLCPLDFPGKNTRVGCSFLLQGIFLTQGSNPGLLHCRWILYRLSRQGSQCYDSFRWTAKEFSQTYTFTFFICRRYSWSMQSKPLFRGTMPGLGKSQPSTSGTSWSPFALTSWRLLWKNA